MEPILEKLSNDDESDNVGDMHCIKCKSRTPNNAITIENITCKGKKRPYIKTTCAVCISEKGKMYTSGNKKQPTIPTDEDIENIIQPHTKNPKKQLINPNMLIKLGDLPEKLQKQIAKLSI